MKSVDQFLNKQFDIQEYNCWHFCSELVLYLTGQDIGDLSPAKASKSTLKEAFSIGKKMFTKLEEPSHMCLVLFERPKANSHVGIYLNEKVLHLKEGGARWENLSRARIGYKTVTYYKL